MGGVVEWEYPTGATPLDPDEAEGLLPQHITTQDQLNEWEQRNILQAVIWLEQKQLKPTNILTTTFMKQLHEKMFSQTWQWAGNYRKSGKNIGVDWSTIPVELKKLFDDVLYQIESGTYSLDECATRFHHRLVFIHPFPNGNGRHARIITDGLLQSLGEKKFSWGTTEQLVKESPNRQRYLEALRAADKFDYRLLLEFVRS